MQTPLGGIDTVKVIRKDGSIEEIKLKVIAIQGKPQSPTAPPEVPLPVSDNQEGGE